MNSTTKGAEVVKERRTTDGKPSVLGRTLRFKGDLKAEEDLVIQGTVEGSIDHSQSLTIGTHGTMVGDIRARVIVVEGSVEGDLHGSESVSVRSSGRVRGSIFSPSVSLAEGAAFNGRVEMDLDRTAQKPAAPPAAATLTSEPVAEKEPAKQLDDNDVERLLGS